MGEKNPCLPAKFDPQVGTSYNPKIHKYFTTANTRRRTRALFSQPDSKFPVALLIKFERQWTGVGRVTFSSDISIRRRLADWVKVACLDRVLDR